MNKLIINGNLCFDTEDTDNLTEIINSIETLILSKLGVKIDVKMVQLKDENDNEIASYESKI